MNRKVIKQIALNLLRLSNDNHCRLCLQLISDAFQTFLDPVTLPGFEDNHLTFRDVLCDVLSMDPKICEEIPGIESVCPECFDKVLEAAKFINQLKKASTALNDIVDNLSHIIESAGSTNKNLYVNLTENECKIIVKDPVKKKNTKIKKELDIFNCKDCRQSFSSFHHLVLHNFQFHTTSTCEICQLTFSDDDSLNEHWTVVHGTACGKGQHYKTTEEALKDHYSGCTECGNHPESDNTESQHLDNRQLNCPNCGKSYQTKSFFIRHMKLCTAGLIDPHPRRSELDKLYSCEQCGKRYSTSGGLRVHMRFEHGNAQHHVCHQCGKKFTAPSYLKVHMLTHTRERNYQCDHCGIGLVTKEALLYHIRRHMGVKPYSCKFCPDKFVNASARAEHVKFKHMEPQFECLICLRKCVTKMFLKKHIERHHKNPLRLQYNVI